MTALTLAYFQWRIWMTVNRKENIFKCMACFTITDCHWALPASLWSGLVLTSLVLFGLFCWRLKRKSTRSGVCTRTVQSVWARHQRQYSFQSPTERTEESIQGCMPTHQTVREPQCGTCSFLWRYSWKSLLSIRLAHRFLFLAMQLENVPGPTWSNSKINGTSSLVKWNSLKSVYPRQNKHEAKQPMIP